MLVIGLTGGIGSGKSTVADIFQQLGASIIDTDELARKLVEPGTPAYQEIISRFPGITLENGQLDRRQLREIVFNDKNKRQQLENILHPRIQQQVEKQLHHLQTAYAIIVIPLLIEKGKWSLIDRIAVVDCSEQQQVERAMQRDNLDESQIRKVIQSQASREQRLSLADDIIRNEDQPDALLEQVQQLDRYYRQLACHPTS